MDLDWVGKNRRRLVDQWVNEVMSLAGFGVLAGGGGIGLTITGVTLTALGEGVVVPALTAWVGDLTPADLRGVIMGGLATANDRGGAVGPLVGYAVGTSLGFGWAYGACVLVFVSVLAALSLVRPDAGVSSRA